MARGCSYCGHNGHNSRTCPDRGVRLFGVRLTDGVMRKSMSMSVPWTEEEHRLFLLGLQKLGKGDWRGISRNFVQTRTPTQVASHAQKYFIRQSNLNKRKRRSSLFDIVSETGLSPMREEPIPNASSDMSTPLHQLSLGSSSKFTPGLYYDSHRFGMPVRPFGLPTHMEAPVAVPAYGRPTNSPSMNSKLVRPTASVPTAPVKIDEAKEMSHLSLGLSPPEPSQLTLKLLDPPSRHSSAFQVNSSFNSSSISPISNAISVV
ncbi:unnamed protein product [Sphagnum compactum]